MLEQVYAQRHHNVCEEIRWHICKNINIPVSEKSWKHEPKVIVENEDVVPMYDLTIPSSVNIEKKAL